jgi:hypothetical protein
MSYLSLPAALVLLVAIALSVSTLPFHRRFHRRFIRPTTALWVQIPCRSYLHRVIPLSGPLYFNHRIRIYHVIPVIRGKFCDSVIKRTARETMWGNIQLGF